MGLANTAAVRPKPTPTLSHLPVLERCLHFDVESIQFLRTGDEYRVERSGFMREGL